MEKNNKLNMGTLDSFSLANILCRYLALARFAKKLGVDNNQSNMEPKTNIGVRK